MIIKVKAYQEVPDDVKDETFDTFININKISTIGRYSSSDDVEYTLITLDNKEEIHCIEEPKDLADEINNMSLGKIGKLLYGSK